MEAKGGGLELAVKDKATWRVAFDSGGLVFSSDDKKLTITKAADAFEVKLGDKLLGKVVTEGKKVLVQDTAGKTKYEGEDRLVAARGVLLAKEIHPLARRIFLAELLARG